MPPPRAARRCRSRRSRSPQNTSKQSTRNYEIDRTAQLFAPARRPRQARHGRGAGRQLRKVGERRQGDAAPADQAARSTISPSWSRTRSASTKRAATVSMSSTQPFLQQTAETLKPEAMPLWQRPWLRDIARLVLGALVLVALALGVLRPLIKNLADARTAAAAALQRRPRRRWATSDRRRRARPSSSPMSSRSCRRAAWCRRIPSAWRRW